MALGWTAFPSSSRDKYHTLSGDCRWFPFALYSSQRVRDDKECADGILQNSGRHSFVLSQYIVWHFTGIFFRCCIRPGKESEDSMARMVRHDIDIGVGIGSASAYISHTHDDAVFPFRLWAFLFLVIEGGSRRYIYNQVVEYSRLQFGMRKSGG